MASQQQVDDLQAELAALRAEVERLTEVSRWYDRTRQDMAKMLGRNDWENTHGLDFTTLLGADLSAAHKALAVLREDFNAARWFVDVLESFHDGQMLKSDFDREKAAYYKMISARHIDAAQALTVPEVKEKP